MIDQQAWRRIENSVKNFERRHRNRPPRTVGPRVQVMGRWYITTSSFAAATFASGTLTMPTGTASPMDTTLGTTTDTAKASGEADITLANGLNGTIASGKPVHAVSTGGRFVIDLAWC
jgi:hypothetical protein